ncbi:class I SAM-dependent methyltransferase, partial [Halobacteriovorax sp.]|uniref:class I SAM-dependent methyltransferase n=1 Tax=Halobacteriovorax sp. TaxID=2020862 RepID=UPI0035651329
MDIQKKINLFKDQLLLARDPAQFNEICSSFFNYNYTSVEEKLTNSSADPQLYLNEQLREEALNTSWYDYYQLIKYSKNQVLDVGSGYSKGTLLALTLGYKNFYSVEFVPERIQWAKIKAQELDLDTSFFFSGDALNIDFSKYEIFLVYQPTGRFLTRFLNSLTQFENKEIWAIESHGDLIHRLDLDSRLIDKSALLELSAKRHDNTIY